MQASTFASKDPATTPFQRAISAWSRSHRTPRWRGLDSNFQFRDSADSAGAFIRRRAGPFFDNGNYRGLSRSRTQRQARLMALDGQTRASCPEVASAQPRRSRQTAVTLLCRRPFRLDPLEPPLNAVDPSEKRRRALVCCGVDLPNLPRGP